MKDKSLFEIVIIGRGGQGAKTASQFIAEAALEENKYIQAFPEYGPERAGAPMKAYTRISDKAITTYSPVRVPDVVMLIDSTLLNSSGVVEDISGGLNEGGILIVNTPKSAEEIKKRTGFKCRLYTLDATKISMETIGMNLPNTPMLGALVKLTKVVPVDSIKKCIRKKFLKKIGEEKTNATIRGVELAYEAVE